MASFFKKVFSKGDNNYVEKTTAQPAETTKLVLEDLNEKEKEYIKSNIVLAEKLLQGLDLVNDKHIFNPTNIDKAIEMWFQQDLQTQFEIDVNRYSNALACGWGQFLVDNLKMEWYVITDNFGTEIGLYHKNNDAVIFPFQSTAKAFNTKNYDLLSLVTDKTNEVVK